MKRNPIVGIIGGAGVAATNKLLEIIENDFTRNGAFRDSNHPEMIIYQATQVPSRSMFLEGKGESFVSGYIQAAQKLEKFGATFLCMNCNTAHYAYEEIAHSVKIPCINLIEECVKEIRLRRKKNIIILTSKGCQIGKVYDKAFHKIYPEANLIYPNTSIQELVTKAICNVKNAKRFLPDLHPDRCKNILDDVINKMCKEIKWIDCDVLLGCTDFRVDYYNSKWVDSTEILAKSIIKESNREVQNE